MLSGRRSIPSLDGLRALAVLLVVVGHVYLQRHAGTDVNGVGYLPTLGVCLFFVISGFLITRLLLRERYTTGRVSLARFYGRRALRLWPALWTFLIVATILGAAGQFTVTLRSVLAALLFSADYVLDHHSTATFHTWSLAVEEQFYLLWPVLLLRLGRRRVRPALVAAITVAPAVRVAAYYAFPSTRGNLGYYLHDRYDLLALGCLLAVFWDSPRLQDVLRRHRGLLLVAALTVLPVEVAAGHAAGPVFSLAVGFSIQAAALTAIVAVTVANGDWWVVVPLNRQPLLHIGVISYSVYLWQQIFTATPFGPFQSWPVRVAAALVAGEVSYRVTEQPFQRWRQALHRKPQAGRPAVPSPAVPVAGERVATSV
jgi:peptidoglycan/LPS O-acetylase OafA/YrhL